MRKNRKTLVVGLMSGLAVLTVGAVGLVSAVAPAPVGAEQSDPPIVDSLPATPFADAGNAEWGDAVASAIGALDAGKANDDQVAAVQSNVNTINDRKQQGQVDVLTRTEADGLNQSGMAVVEFPETFPSNPECVNVHATPVRNHDNPSNAPVFVQIAQPTASQFTVRLFNKDMQGISGQNVRFMYTAFATDNPAECLAS